MWSNVVNMVIAAGLTIALLRYGVSLEMALLVGYTAGCFCMLWDINSTLRKSK